MTTKLRFVFDTNVIISAVLIKQSVSRRALEKARVNGTLLISSDTLNELQQVLQRKKFKNMSQSKRELNFYQQWYEKQYRSMS